MALSLRDLAINALDEQKRQEAAIEARLKNELSDQTERAFMKLFYDMNVPFYKVDGDSVTCEDVILHAGKNYDKTCWQVEGTCPNCGIAVLSIPCNDLAGIGEQLVNFQPFGHSHKVLIEMS